jgi:Icc protein
MSDSLTKKSSRREFVLALGVTAASISLAAEARARVRLLDKRVRIGLIADLHQDIMHDGEARLDDFLSEMDRVKPDAIMQLGDFAYPSKANKSVIDKFNQAHTTSLHVIGNHDTDSGHTKQQCLDVWGMSERFYHQDIGGLRFLVLDGNDKGSPTHQGGYVKFVGKQQVTWLKEQLRTFNGPIVVVCHQPLAGSSAIDNAKEIQQLLSSHADKVVLCLNGHTHIDDLIQVEKISYLHVNSASYKWVGGTYKHESYSPEVHKNHRSISSTCPYQDALFTTLTFDPDNAAISIQGKESTWVGKSPEDLGIVRNPQITDAEAVAPRIRSRQIERVKA